MGLRWNNQCCFVDCKINGVPDLIDIEVTQVSADVDRDRIPSECEIPLPADVEFIGIVGGSNQLVTSMTCGRNFDREIVFWDAYGNLIEAKGDFGSPQSEITRMFEPGICYGVWVGSNAVFRSSFRIQAKANGCPESGALQVVLGSQGGMTSV